MIKYSEAMDRVNSGDLIIIRRTILHIYLIDVVSRMHYICLQGDFADE